MCVAIIMADPVYLKSVFMQIVTDGIHNFAI